MPLYRVAKEKLEPVKQTTFVEEKFLERRDLQRYESGHIGSRR